MRYSPHRAIFDRPRRRGAARPGAQIGASPPVPGSGSPIQDDQTASGSGSATSPPTLQFVGRITSGTQLNNPLGLAASGDLIVVAATGDNPDEVTIIDASTPASPTIVGNDGDTNFNGATNVALIDADHAIVTCGSNLGRVSTVDFSTPGAAVLFDGTADDSTNLFLDRLGVAVIGTNAFISGNKLGTLDVSNPSAPSFTNIASDSDYAGSTGRRPLVAVGDNLFLVSDNQVTVTDASSPNAPTVIGSYVDATKIGTSGPGSIDVAGDLAAVLGASGWLTILDVSDPSNPQFLGELQIDTSSPFDTRDCRIVGDYVVVARTLSIVLIDITDPSNPSQVHAYPDDGFTNTTEYLCRFGADMVAVSAAVDDTVTILQVVS